MADIGNLNFAVIIDDKDFNAKVAAIESKAKELNTKVSNILEGIKVKDLITSSTAANAKSFKDALDEIKNILANMPSVSSWGKDFDELKNKVAELEGRLKDVIAAIKEGASGTSKHAEALKRAKENADELSKAMSSLKTVFGAVFSLAALKGFLSSTIEITGQLEMMRVAMGHILGDMEKSNTIFKQLRELSIPSYFNLPDLGKYAKQLTALSIPYDELYETTRRLADVTAGVGVSFERIALAYGHIRSMGFLRGMQARQLTNAGIPIFEELAKNLTMAEDKLVSISEVYDRMAKRQITFAQVKDVFEQMTNEGGKFYNMQIALTDTLAGSINKLKGQWQLVLNDIGSRSSGGLKWFVNLATELVKAFEYLSYLFPGIIAGFVAFGAAISVSAFKHYISNIWVLITNIKKATRNTEAWSVAIANLGGKVKATGAALGGIVGILATVGFLIYEAVSSTDDLTRELGENQKKVIEEKEELAKLIDVLKEEKSSRAERLEAISQINGKYEQYLGYLISEKTSVEELSDAYDTLTSAIERKGLEDYKQSVLKEPKAQLTESLADLLQTLTNKASDIPNIGRIVAGLNVKLSNRELTSWTDIATFIADELEKEGMAFGRIEGILGELSGTASDAMNFRRTEDGKIAPGVGYKDALIGNQNEIGNYLSALQELQKAEEKYANFEKGWNNYFNSHGFIVPLLSFNKAKEFSTKDLITSYDTNLSDEEKKKINNYVTEWQLAVLKERERLIKGKSPKEVKVIDSILNYGEEVSQDEFLESLRKGYDSATKLRDSYITEDRKKDSELQLKIFGQLPKSWLAASKTIKDEESDAEKQRKTRVDGIKTEISILRKYMEVYNAFSALVGEEYAKGLTNKAFGKKGEEAIKDFGFLKLINLQIDELKKIAKQPELDWIESLYSQLGIGAGKDMVKQLSEAQKTADTYSDLIRTLSAEDTSVHGKGFWHDITKVVSDLQTKLNKIEISGNKAKKKLFAIDKNSPEAKKSIIYSFIENGMTEDEANRWWDTWVNGGEKAIENLLESLRNKAKENAKESARDLAARYYQDSLKEYGIDFSNIGKWSIKELKRVKAALQEIVDIANGRVGIDWSRIDMETSGLTFGENGIDFKEGFSVEDVIQNIEAANGPLSEQQKKFLRLLYIIRQLNLELKEFGDNVKKANTGNTGKTNKEEEKQTARVLSRANKSVQKVTKGMSELFTALGNDNLAAIADAIGQISNGITDIYQGFKSDTFSGIFTATSFVFDTILDSLTASAKLKAAIAEAAAEAKVVNAELRLEKGTKTIFGENQLKKFQNALEEIKKITPSINQDMRGFWSNSFASGIGNGVEKTAIKWKSGLFSLSTSSKNLKKAVEELGYELYDEYGNLNEKGLQAILDTYPKLTSASRAWIKQAIADSKVYREAMEQLDEVLEGIYGDVASSIADKAIERWRQLGNAAGDYRDILDDVAAQLAKVAIEQAVLENFFDEEFHKELRSFISKKDYTGAMDLLETTLNEVEAAAPDLTMLIDKVGKWLKPEGGDDLGQSIASSITEEQANLLASYINAIRSDTSALRAIQTIGFADVKAIRNILESREAPNYNEYMAQIAANTYDSARSNREILIEIQGVITNAGNGRGIRAYIN